MLHVAAAILKNERGEILICRRGAGGDCAFLWEFPGGKVEPGETAAQCATRECQEELGVKVVLDGVFGRTTYRYPSCEISFTFLQGRIALGAPTASVHTALSWVTPARLGEFAFCPADMEIIKQLQK